MIAVKATHVGTSFYQETKIHSIIECKFSDTLCGPFVAQYGKVCRSAEEYRRRAFTLIVKSTARGAAAIELTLCLTLHDASPKDFDLALHYSRTELGRVSYALARLLANSCRSALTFGLFEPSCVTVPPTEMR
jgi:hypothetical protein